MIAKSCSVFSCCVHVACRAIERYCSRDAWSKRRWRLIASTDCRHGAGSIVGWQLARLRAETRRRGVVVLMSDKKVWMADGTKSDVVSVVLGIVLVLECGGGDSRRLALTSVVFSVTST
jgi:hypothetical protein